MKIMELNEYIEKFTSDVKADADSFQTTLREAFLTNVADRLVEAEVITSYEVGYFRKTGRQGRKVEIDGYSYEDADGTFNLFVVDDVDDPEKNLTDSLLDSLIRPAEELVHCGIEKKFDNWEESSPGFVAGCDIYRLFHYRENKEIDFDLKKIRIYVLTNKTIGSRFKNKKREDIYEIPVDFSVYDATRLYEMAKVGFEKEPVDIHLDDYGISGVYGIKTTEKADEFESFLAAVPGQVLADIYLENGTQVLEGNVRAFLSVRGKVNKGIRKTIIQEPEKFFILNNGITVTSEGIESTQTDNGLLITQINNMQIVNGGQTTASLANTLLKDKADLSKVQVMMKLSVLKSHEISNELVPEISRASNSQNKIDEADFFSNHPFHIKFQELSQKNLAPAVDGNQYQTEWFYERARGQYTVEQMKLTKGQQKAWQLKHPKNQVIRKTDLAKYIMSYDGYPQYVSKGAQAVMREFSKVIQGPNGDDGLWAKNSSSVNNTYYKEAIAKAIIFKETEKLVSGLEWYKEIKAYRANIVTYTIAVLENYAKSKKMTFDLNKIWNNQQMYEGLRYQCEITSKQIYDFLTRDDRTTLNVTEWAKKEECWKRAKQLDLRIAPGFESLLVSERVVSRTELKEDTVDSMSFVVSKDVSVWEDMKEWGKRFLYLSAIDEKFIDLAIRIHTQGKIPTDKQFARIVKVYNDMVAKGFKDKTLV
jgi:hypothetical protein